MKFENADVENADIENADVETIDLESKMKELFAQINPENFVENLKEQEEDLEEDLEEDQEVELEVDEEIKVTSDFIKVLLDFTKDLTTTFPDIIDSNDNPIKELNKYLEKKDEEKEEVERISKFIYQHCRSIFPRYFFDILYENKDIFSNREKMYLIPGVNFIELWNADISENTKSTIWKYLKLILFTVIGDLNSDECFGDSAKLFEAINSEEFKEKIQSSLEEMESIFNRDKNNEEPMELPQADKLHDHIDKMMNGKLGCLAKEIAEETAEDLDLNVENVTSVNDVFNKLFKNPGKLMDLVKNVGGKLDNKIKSGHIKESELLQEASEFVSNMKNMPGIGNIESFLSKMGMPGIPGMGGGTKVNMGAVNKKMQDNLKAAKMKERMKAKLDKRKEESNVFNTGKTTMDMPEYKFTGIQEKETTESKSKPNINRKKKKKKPPNVANSSKE